MTEPPSASPQSDPREPPRATPREAALIAAGVTVGTTLAVTYTFDPARAGTASMLAIIGALYAVSAAATVSWLRRRGELRAALRPAYGDLSKGALIGALLYGAGMGARLLLAPPASPRAAWILRIDNQIGDHPDDTRMLLGGLVFVIAALEELVWRGLVMRALEGPMGRDRAWILSSVLYAAAHLPTVFLLADPVAGPNPLLVAAALGCGLVWGRVVHRFGRLAPALFAHALFSWAIVSFPLIQP